MSPAHALPSWLAKSRRSMEYSSLDEVLVSDTPDPPVDHAAAGAVSPPAPDGQSRYHTLAEGGSSWIVCASAPNLRLRVDRALALTEAARKKMPRQAIFLDGAYAEGPLFDNEQRHYSLDHHAGCHRPITLATCEQAAVMLAQGLPLGEGEWRLFVNEPDLDAVIASWLLLNHAELTQEDDSPLWDVMPLVRAEGVIDAHGLDRGFLSGLSPANYERQKARIDALRAKEQQLRTAGSWAMVDVVAHTVELLDALDRMLYSEEQLGALLDIVEVAQVPIERKRSSAVLCRSNLGIYAVETRLRQRHEGKVGVIVLDSGNGRFTLRQLDSFLQRNLADVYPLLNERDERVQAAVAPEAPASGEREDNENRWGGSEEIGGSPRGTGTALTGEEILDAVQQAYGGSTWLHRIVRRIRP